MRNAFTAELLKMRTTRTFYALSLTAAGLTLAITLVYSLAASSSDIESQGSDLFLENQNDVNRFTAIFEHLRALALPPEGSTALLRRIARDMRKGAEA